MIPPEHFNKTIGSVPSYFDFGRVLRDIETTRPEVYKAWNFEKLTKSPVYVGAGISSKACLRPGTNHVYKFTNDRELALVHQHLMEQGPKKHLVTTHAVCQVRKAGHYGEPLYVIVQDQLYTAKGQYHGAIGHWYQMYHRVGVDVKKLKPIEAWARKQCRGAANAVNSVGLKNAFIDFGPFHNCMFSAAGDLTIFDFGRMCPQPLMNKLNKHGKILEI